MQFSQDSFDVGLHRPGRDHQLDRYQVIALTDDPGTKQTASLLTHAYVRLPLHLS